MYPEFVRHTRVLDIVGDTIRVKASDVALGDLGVVENVGGDSSMAKVVGLERDIAPLQVFAGGKGLSTGARVRFLGHGFQVVCSENILGRIFRGSGELIDGGPDISNDRKIEIEGPTVNPMKRVMTSKMIQTEIPRRHSREFLQGGEPGAAG